MTSRPRHLQIVAKRFLSRHKSTLLAALFFFLVACVLTWPFIAQTLSTQVGAKYGDIVGSISKFEAIKNEENNPFFDRKLSSIAYPDGIRSNVGVDRVSVFSTTFIWGLTSLVNATFAHSLLIFLGYFLSSFVMYLFVRRYMKSEKLGLVAGILFITYPLFISLARAAPVYMWAWLYILPLWTMIELTKHYSHKRLVLACLSIVPGIFWTPYFLLHTLLIALACFMAYAVMTYKKSGKIPYRPMLALGLAAILVMGVYAVVGRTGGSASVPQRTMTDAYEQSLHPLMLITPTPRTVATFPFYEDVIKPIRPRGVDTNLYIGIIVTLLAFIGAFTTIKRSKMTYEMRLVGIFAIAIALISLSFSLAPTISIFGLNIPTPNYLVVHFVPAMRAGQRLVVPMMVGVVILATIGLWRLTHYLHKRARPMILLPFVFVVIFCEYFIEFEDMTAPVHVSAAMSSLAETKQGVVAEYLNDSLIGYPGQLACKNYFIHKHPMVNPCSLDIYTEPGRWPIVEAIDRMDMAGQMATLKQLGVKYVIVDDKASKAEYYLRATGSRLFANDAVFRIYEL